MKVDIFGIDGFIGSHLADRVNLDHITPELVYHLAAYPKILGSIKNPFLAFENIRITYELLEQMRQQGITNIIMASTQEPLESPYVASKIASEALITAFCKAYDMSGISIRLPNIYGDNDREDRFIPTIIRKAKHNLKMYIYGKDGDFMHIDDCVDLLLRLQKKLKKGEHRIYKYNNKRISLAKVAEKIIKLTGSKSTITLEKGLKGII